MKKRITMAALICGLLLLFALPALAADVFRYAQESVEVYDGESVTPEILRDGKYLDGEIVFSVNGKICSVDENGTITGITPGRVYVQADLQQDGKNVRHTSILVSVVRKATKLTLNTRGLQVYEPDDAAIQPLLKPRDPETEEPIRDQILLMLAGKGFYPKCTITPEDVRNKQFISTTSDAGVLKITGDGQLVAVQRGECELTFSSKQFPEITETFHVVVIEPVKKIQITSAEKTVAAGKTIQLDTELTPENASIRDVQWSSRSEKIATVDENGLVTGVAKGTVYIDAKTTDGSNLTASFYLTVTQDVTEITIRETDVTVATGRRAPQLHTDVLPQNANDRRVTWSSSDETIATVQNGTITGRKAGDCTVTCTSIANPEVSISIPVHVIQMVTDITFLTPQGLSFHIGESRQLEWQVSPEDASIQEVTFSSRAPKVAVVDQNGIVTGLAKGQADIEAKATDGSGKYRVYRVTILKPVEGIEPLAEQYFAQLNRSTDIRGKVYPSDASNQRILWSGDNDYIATVTQAGTSTGRIIGRQRGWFTLTATTEDGGYSSSASVLVDDFDSLVMCGGAYIDENNKIRLVFWNMSRDFNIAKVHFHVDCYDTQGQPMVCCKDGVSTTFSGNYPLLLAPGARTEHGRFNFFEYQATGLYGYVVVTITGYEFENGQKWWIPEDKQIPYRSTDSSHMGEPTPEPPATPAPEETNG